MDLADAAFGDSEDRSDLFHIEIFVVVERDDEALFLGQCVDRVGDDVLGLPGLERREGVFSSHVFDDAMCDAQLQ